MKNSIILITIILCTLYSCTTKWLYTNNVGEYYPTIEGTNYPFIVEWVKYESCYLNYNHKLKNVAFHTMLNSSFEKGDTLLLVEKSYLDSLLKK